LLPAPPHLLPRKVWAAVVVNSATDGWSDASSHGDSNV